VTLGALTYTGNGSAVNDTLTISSASGKYTFTDTVLDISLTAGATSAGWTGSGTHTVTGNESSITGAILVDADTASGDATTVSSFDNTLPGSFTITNGPKTTLGNVKSVGAQSYTATISTTLGGNLTTHGGTVTFSGPALLSGTDAIDTTNSGGSAPGANVNFNGTLNNAGNLTITCGTGHGAAFQAVGATTPLTSLSVTGTTNTLSSTVTTTGSQSYSSSTKTSVGASLTSSGGAFTFTGPVVLTGTATVDSTNAGSAAAGANVTFSSTVNGTTAGTQALTVNGGTGGAIAFQGTVGGTTSLSTLTATGKTISAISVKTSGAEAYTGSTSTSLGGTYTSSGGTFTVTGPALLTATTTVDTTNAGTSPAGANITFSSTIDGTHILTLKGGMGGAVAIDGSTGSTTVLTSLTITGYTVTVAAVTTSGTQSYSGTTSNTFNGNLTTAKNAVTVNGPALLGNSINIDTTNNAGNPAGANITFVSTLDAASSGVQSLTIKNGSGGPGGGAGSLGIVSFNGSVGSSVPLGGITAIGNEFNLSAITTTTGGESFTGAGSNPSATLKGNLTTAGGNIKITCPTILDVSLVIDTTAAGSVPDGGNVTFNSTVNAASAGAESLTATTGIMKGIGFTSVGATAPLAFLSLSGNAQSATGSVITTGYQSYNTTGGTTPNSKFGGNLTTSGATITVVGPVILAGTVTVDTTNGGGSPAGANVSLEGTVDGTTSGAQGLTVTPGTGGSVSIGLTGSLVPLASLSATGTTIAVAGATVSGAVTLTGSGTVTVGDGTITPELITAGSFTLTAGGSGVVIASNGGLSGPGTVNANVSNGGAINPGGIGTVGTISIFGSYTQLSTGSLNVDVGLNADLLAVHGIVALGGALNVDTVAGFNDVLGASYQVITFTSRTTGADGAPIDFATRTGLILGSGHVLNPVYSVSDLELVDSQPGVDVTADVSITDPTGFQFNPSTLHVTEQLVIQNTSASPLSGPLNLELTGLAPSISLANRTGNAIVSSPGSPYITVSAVSLAPGASDTITLDFYDPTFNGITYIDHLFAGGVP
jgi:hypothetical protein